MDFLTTTVNLVLIIVGFGILIFVHELGHFLAAKWAGIRTEVFAVGMGTPMFAWRKGIGLVWGSTHRRVVAKTGKAPADLGHQELARHGLGETEYSLRWLPIGGFVKMLGQDDVNPSYVSADPRSYNVCPVGKRMVVVSAGVLANLLLAIFLFIVAFLVGVKFEAPIVGSVAASLPAGTTAADNAEVLGISTVGVQPGDLVARIDGRPVRTFADVHIASAMSKPGVPLALTVQRAGVAEPLRFTLIPQVDEITGLLSIGLFPASSTTLFEKDPDDLIRLALEKTGAAEAGVEPGMTMIRAGGVLLRTFEQFQHEVDASEGRAVPTVWSAVDGHGEPVGPTVGADIPVRPRGQLLRYPELAEDGLRDVEQGLFGLTPLMRIEWITPSSENVGVLETGDVVLRVGPVHAPRLAQLRGELERRAGGEISMTVLRDGQEVDLDARVDRRGMLNILPQYAWDLPYTASPMRQTAAPAPDGDELVARDTPVADLLLMGGTRIDAVNGVPVGDWAQLREMLRAHTADAAARGDGETVSVAVTHPTPGREGGEVDLVLTAEDVRQLHELGWFTDLSATAFQPLYTTLSAGNNPLAAMAMGFHETYTFVMMTYLTIDRLLRGSVGVEQIRGPVGIVHIGAKVADRGLMYLIFFLGIISVNLAVINFLPIPIVDGGLLLFLVYEKLKGRPPSLTFQNAATVVGLVMIATVLLVVTWNDIVRLMS
ncbi:MAG: site-2 protease family protein [Planctomycetota bacterium]|jgi:regulator of sigma E protease